MIIDSIYINYFIKFEGSKRDGIEGVVCSCINITWIRKEFF